MKKTVLLALIVSVCCVNAGDTLHYTLDTLQSIARKNYPQTRQLFLSQESVSQAVKNVNSAWLPRVAVAGSATYQSEVPSLSLPPQLGFSMTEIPKDQYKAGIEVSQLLFDGGISHVQKNIEELSGKSDWQKTELELRNLRSQISLTVENILVLKESCAILSYAKADLEERRKSLSNAVEAGTAIASSRDELDAEIFSTQEKIIDNKSTLAACCKTLSLLAGISIDTDAVVSMEYSDSDGSLLSDDISGRPDYRQLEAQSELLNSRISLINRNNAPRLSAYANGYYGRTGLNIYNIDMHFYGITGLNLSWNIGGNYSTLAQKRQLAISRESLEVQRQTLALSVRLQLESVREKIAKLKKMITLDDRIAEIRTSVKKVAQQQVDAGTMTISDYTVKLNDESAALANRSIHRIQLAASYIEYKTILGK
jgi:outer membrane protein TolC